jgi:class 3 adenylate cyclase
MALFLPRIAEVIGGYKGTVARNMGDGVLAYFGSCPVSFASASVNVSAMRNSISCASIQRLELPRLRPRG